MVRVSSEALSSGFEKDILSSLFSAGSTQVNISTWLKIIDREVKHQLKQTKCLLVVYSGCFLAHLSCSDKVSFCDRSLSVVVVRSLTMDLNDISLTHGPILK